MSRGILNYVIFRFISKKDDKKTLPKGRAFIISLQD